MTPYVLDIKIKEAQDEIYFVNDLFKKFKDNAKISDIEKIIFH